MKKARLILILIPALLAGTFYAWLHEPTAIYSFDIPLLLVLSALAMSSAFLSGLVVKTNAEHNILISTAGILLAVLINMFAFGIEFVHPIHQEVFILLFFSGHASLIGTYSALFVKSLRFKFKYPAKKVQRTERYPQYSIAE